LSARLLPPVVGFQHLSKGVIGENAVRKAVPQNVTGHEPNGEKLKC
jgi:hypothetical protein